MIRLLVTAVKYVLSVNAQAIALTFLVFLLFEMVTSVTGLLILALMALLIIAVFLYGILLNIADREAGVEFGAYVRVALRAVRVCLKDFIRYDLHIPSVLLVIAFFGTITVLGLLEPSGRIGRFEPVGAPGVSCQKVQVDEFGFAELSECSDKSTYSNTPVREVNL
jgi:hypothetical protein